VFLTEEILHQDPFSGHLFVFVNRRGDRMKILVWDGAKRILYVDDAEVASKTRIGFVGSAGGLFIGAGSTLAPAASGRA
jgi:hypothetical protein